MTQAFAHLGLHDALLRSLTESNYQAPSPIQEQAIPHLLVGKNVLGQAQTGTGKTAAFGLPMLQLIPIGTPNVQALVLTPTRELATQVGNALFQYGKYLGVRVLPIYGGQSYDRQFRRLEKGVDVVVATPGRLLDLIQQKMINLKHVRYLVLDEADEMLKMGFIDDVRSILAQLPIERQTALFSATMPNEIRSIANQFIPDAIHIAVQNEKMTVQQIEQRYYLVPADAKVAALARLLETEDMQSALIFTKTRAASAELSDTLLKRGYMASSISGDLSQDAREAVLRRFRNGDLPILVATDVVARGVDIPQVSHVFNFDMPQNDEDYVHRIGRTGRAGRSGTAITLVTSREVRQLQFLERFIKQSIPQAQLPRLEDIRARRETTFFKKLEEMIISGEKDLGKQALEFILNAGYQLEDVATAALQLARADELEAPIEHIKTVHLSDSSRSNDRDRRRQPAQGSGRGRPSDRPSGDRMRNVEEGMVRLKIDLGRNDNVRPADVVSTVAVLGGIQGKRIGAIRIQDAQTFFEVPEDAVQRVLTGMKNSKMCGKPITVVRG